MACRNNLQGCILLKEINHWVLVFFLPIFIFYKKMYSQKDETCFRGSRDWYFFCCPTMMGRPLQFGSGVSLILLNIKRLKNFKIYVCTIVMISQNLREKIRNCRQEQYTMELFANCITCVNWLPIKLWILEVEELNQLMLPKYDALFEHIGCFPWILK